MGGVEQCKHTCLTSDCDSGPISECLLCARNCVQCCKHIILVFRMPWQSHHCFCFTAQGLHLRKVPPPAQGCTVCSWWARTWLPRWCSDQESACHCRSRKRHGFHPWVGKSPWRRKWPPTPVFLPGESHGQRSLVGYSPWGCKRVGHDWATEHTEFV